MNYFVENKENLRLKDYKLDKTNQSHTFAYEIESLDISFPRTLFQ